MIYYSGTNKLLLILSEQWKLFLFLSFVFFVYFYYTSTFNFFEKRGIKYMKPIIFFGNTLDRIICKQPYGMFQLQIYNYFKGEPCGGIFEGRRPVLYIIDPEIIKAVLIRDFDHFTDRGTIQIKQPKYLSRSVVSLKGSEWKAVRSLITPAFNSGRIKNMFPLIQQCTNQFIKFLDKYDKTNVELKDASVHLTLEVIGVCAFGISSDALQDENAEFKKIAIKFNSMSLLKRLLLFGMMMISPSLFKYINLPILNYESTKKLSEILRETRTKRAVTGTRRNDFLQLLIDASDAEKQDVGNKSKIHLDDITVDAQALIFHLAGFESTSSILSFTLYELALHPDIQEKLRAHIEDITKGEELCYDHLVDLDYLEAIITESLRMYSPLSRIDRACTKPYTLPGTSIHLAVGDVIAISVHGVHMDPDIYPEPSTFKPERFAKEAKNKIPSHLFLPFGAGSRNCIGARFAMVILKTSLVSVLRNYKFSMCVKTEVPLQFSTETFLLKSDKGVWVQVDRI